MSQRRLFLFLPLLATLAPAAEPVRFTDSGKPGMPPRINARWALAGDGAVFVTNNLSLGAPYNGVAALWFDASGRERSRLEFPRLTSFVAVSPSGDRIAVRNFNGPLEVWSRGGRLLGSSTHFGQLEPLFLRGNYLFGVSRVTGRPRVVRLDYRTGLVEPLYPGVTISDPAPQIVDVSDSGTRVIVNNQTGTRYLVEVGGVTDFFRYSSAGVGFLRGSDRYAVVYGGTSTTIAWPDALTERGDAYPVADQSVSLASTGADGSVYFTASGFASAPAYWRAPFRGAAVRLPDPPPAPRWFGSNPAPSGIGQLGDSSRVLVSQGGAFSRIDLARNRVEPFFVRAAVTAGSGYYAAGSENARTAVFVALSDLYGPVPDGSSGLTMLWREGKGLTPVGGAPELRFDATLTVSPKGAWFVDPATQGWRSADDLTPVRMFTDLGNRDVATKVWAFLGEEENRVVYRAGGRFLVRDPRTRRVARFANDSTVWGTGTESLPPTRFVGGVGSRVAVATLVRDGNGVLLGVRDAVLDADAGRALPSRFWRLPPNFPAGFVASSAGAVTPDGRVRLITGAGQVLRVTGSGAAATYVLWPDGTLSADGRWWVTREGMYEVATGEYTPLSFDASTKRVGPAQVYRQGGDAAFVWAGR